MSRQQPSQNSPLWPLIAEAESSATAVARLAELSVHPSEWVRRPVQTNPSTPDDLLLAMIADPRNKKKLYWGTALRGRSAIEWAVASMLDVDVRVDLAQAYRWDEGQLSRAVQQLLASDISRAVRAAVAATVTYEDVFVVLLSDADAEVRRNCADNPRATREHIEQLMADRSWRVRHGTVVFGHRYPDGVQLERLAEDKSSEVRWAVVQNLRATRAAIEKIALDTDEMNQSAARMWLSSGPPYVPLDEALEAAAARSWAARPGAFDTV